MLAHTITFSNEKKSRLFNEVSYFIVLVYENSDVIRLNFYNQTWFWDGLIEDAMHPIESTEINFVSEGGFLLKEL